MTENKWINMIKTIYQDTSTEHDLQIKRVIEAVFEAGREHQREVEPHYSYAEEREEAEA